MLYCVKILFVADNSQANTKTNAPIPPYYSAFTTSSTFNPRLRETTTAISYISRVTEASTLSAFLVPGGQLPSSGSVNLRPSGRSTITKVASPHLSYNAEREQSREKQKFAGAQRSADIDETTKVQNEAFVINEEAEVIDDNPINWYFQHYNDTNLEPYVGIAYSSATKIDVYQWLFFIVFSILLYA